MATEALGEERPALFLRKATGLVRGWSVRDSMIYAILATNFVTLAIYEFAFAAPAFPKGQLITSVLISGIWVSFLVIAYAGLVVTIPRAGGDYVWQTRILGSGIGFVMSATGWWFILWLWAPIYGNILAVQFFEPLWATLKWTWPTGGAAWFGTHNGIFLVSMITISGASTVAWSDSGSSWCCCWSTRTPTSSARSTSRRTSFSALTTPTGPRRPRPPRSASTLSPSDSARSGRPCSWCR